MSITKSAATRSLTFQQLDKPFAQDPPARRDKAVRKGQNRVTTTSAQRTVFDCSAATALIEVFA
jgi:hypothetical protein